MTAKTPSETLPKTPKDPFEDPPGDLLEGSFRDPHKGRGEHLGDRKTRVLTHSPLPGRIKNTTAFAAHGN